MTAMDTEARLARIETKLDALIVSNEKVTDDHEKRLRGLERWKYALPTSLVLAVGSVLAALLGGVS